MGELFNCEVGLWWKRGPCSDCGAHTIFEAETKCRPHQDQSGEYYCAQPDGHEDAEGYFVQETDHAIAVRDAWVDEEVAKMKAEEALTNQQGSDT